MPNPTNIGASFAEFAPLTADPPAPDSGGTQLYIKSVLGVPHVFVQTDSAAVDITASIGSALLAANNLSDLASASTARTNLGVAYGKQTVWIPSGAWTTRTTAGAASGKTEATTNKEQINGLDFDAATVEYAQATIVWPKSWDDGTVTAKFFWRHGATTTNFGVVWGLQGVCIGNDDTLDVAFGTAQEVTDTGGTTDDLYVSDESAAITIAGTPTDDELCFLQLYRLATSGSDTMAVDARLLGVRLKYTANAANDT